MKEIIIVTNNLADDGAARVLSELSKEWVKTGNKVSVYQIRSEYFTDSYNMPKEVEIVNIVSPINNRFVRRIIQASKLIKILRSKRNATVLAFLNPAYLLIGICSPFIKNKIVFSERNDPNRVPKKKVQRIMRDNLFRLADVSVFQTQKAKDHFCKKVQQKGVIIANPMNNSLPPVYSGKRGKTIVAVCRLNEQKNIPMMIHAFQKLSIEFPEYSLKIYGRGELEEEIKNLILSLKLEDKVFLMGFTYNVFEKIHDATMFVSSSNYEGISNSMLEAMGMGIPVVCTDCPCGGEEMYIKNGENGFLVPVGDSDAMYIAMKKVLEGFLVDSNLYEGAYRLRKELALENIAGKWLEIL